MLCCCWSFWGYKMSLLYICPTYFSVAALLHISPQTFFYFLYFFSSSHHFISLYFTYCVTSLKLLDIPLYILSTVLALNILPAVLSSPILCVFQTLKLSFLLAIPKSEMYFAELMQWKN